MPTHTNKIKPLLLAIGTSLLLVGCLGGGGGGGSSNTDSPVQQPGPGIVQGSWEELSIVSRSGYTAGGVTEIQVQGERAVELGPYSWLIVDAPSLSAGRLDAENALSMARLTAFEPGEYRIHIESAGIDQPYEFSISIPESLAFDPEKLHGYDPTIPLSSQAGAVINQFWVQSRTLDRMALEALIPTAEMDILGYDKIFGLLVELDQYNPQAYQALDVLEKKPGIELVRSRKHIGADLYQLNSAGTVYDGCGTSPLFDWSKCPHIDVIGLHVAWRLLEEHKENGVKAGVLVADGGFDLDHEEFKGLGIELRLGKEKPTQREIQHGNSSMGAIAAPLNGKGYVGVWPGAELKGASMPGKCVDGEGNTSYSCMVNILSKNAAPKIVNMSFSHGVGNESLGAYLFDPTDYRPIDIYKTFSCTHAQGLLSREEAKLCGSWYYEDTRALIESYPDALFVQAAGNGFNNANGYALPGTDVKFYGHDASMDAGALHYRFVHASPMHLSGAELFQHPSYRAAYRERATLNNLLVVGAACEDGSDYRACRYSNFGDTVDIWAPVGFQAPTGVGRLVGSQYAAYTGTSAAAPIVSGVAALVLSANPELTAAEVKQVLLDTAVNRNGMNIVNAGNAVRMAIDLRDRSDDPDQPINQPDFMRGQVLLDNHFSDLMIRVTPEDFWNDDSSAGPTYGNGLHCRVAANGSWGDDCIHRDDEYYPEFIVSKRYQVIIYRDINSDVDFNSEEQTLCYKEVFGNSLGSIDCRTQSAPMDSYIFSITPTVVTLNTSQLFEIRGQWYDEAMAFSIEDAECGQYSVVQPLAESGDFYLSFNCIPRASGTKKLFAATYSGGPAIAGSGGIYIQVK